MLDLKNQYEGLAGDAKSADPDLAAQAQTQADNRNYLDAVRFALAPPTSRARGSAHVSGGC